MVLAEFHSCEEMTPQVHAALRAWYGTAGDDKELLEGLFLVQEKRRARSDSTTPTALRLATNEVLLEGIDELGIGDPEAATILKMRFVDDSTLARVALKTNQSEDSVSRKQRSAIGSLTEILCEREVKARQERALAIEARLPPSTYTRLFGLDDAQAQLLERLAKPDGPGVVAIVGIGGIGKTALADSVARRIAQRLHFEDVIWLTSDPQTMSGQSLSPQLTFEGLLADMVEKLGLGLAAPSLEQRLAQIRPVLKGRPLLVIIDNLETDAETAYLLAHLNDLAGPSKFLLTTRTRPTPQATVFHFEINELPFKEARALALQHAGDIGLSDLEQGGDEPVRAIYNVTGGNPLALKVVISLIDLLPLQQILSDLIKSRPGEIEDLYKRIYWQAWQILSPEAKSLLQAMPLVGETGGLPDFLQTISNLPADRFWPALGELRHRSLVEVRGTIEEKRYGIHRLTESFLRTEIIHWPADQ